jgi:hypothetical protein
MVVFPHPLWVPATMKACFSDSTAISEMCESHHSRHQTVLSGKQSFTKLTREANHSIHPSHGEKKAAIAINPAGRKNMNEHVPDRLLYIIFNGLPFLFILRLVVCQ